MNDYVRMKYVSFQFGDYFLRRSFRMKVMSKFWTVIVSVVLLICAVVMTPMQMVGGTSWKSNGVKVSTGSKGEKIGDVEQFSELLQCFMNRSDNMSLQQDGGNYVLSASDLLSRAEEQLGYGDVEYSSWTTTVDLFASVDYEGVYVEMLYVISTEYIRSL